MLKKYSWIGYLLVMMGGGYLAGIWIQKVTVRTPFFHTEYFEKDGKPRLLCFMMMNDYNEDDGDCLIGYKIRYMDPVKKEILDEVDIDRYDSNPPPWPLVRFYKGSEIWIIQTKQFVQGDTGFVVRLTLKNEKLEIEKKNSLQGYTPESFYGSQWVIVRNKFNEVYCANLVTEQVTGGNCPTLPQPYDTVKTAFISVKKDVSGVRSHIYFYSSPKTASMNETGVLHENLLYFLWGSRNVLTLSDLEYWKSRFSQEDKLVPVYTDQYIINANCLLQTGHMAVFHEKDITTGMENYYAFSSDGKMNWKVSGKKYASVNTNVSPQCSIYKNKTILSSVSWVFCVNNETGKIEWSYKP